MPPPLVVVSLETSDFQHALHRYIDEDKPDPLQQRQMESWEFHWTNSNSTSATATATATATAATTDDNDVYEETPLQEYGSSKKKNGTEKDAGENDLSVVQPDEGTTTRRYALVGKLDWKGEYLTVTLWTECYWKTTTTATERIGRDDNKLNQEEGGGELSFKCTCSAKFRHDDEEDDATAKKKRIIRSKMISRLQQDAYIRKILKNTKTLSLCEATIRVAPQDHQHPLEERVHTNPEIAEAIRRSIFSTASSSLLDVWDLICHFPFLPSTSTGHGRRNNSASTTTPLADRARLRLQEDATYDACEEEEEEDDALKNNIQDLQLDGNQQQQHKKRSKQK